MAAAIQASSEFLKGKAEFQETQLATKEKNIRRVLVSLQKLQEKFPNCKWTHNQMEKAKVQVEEIENKREAFRFHTSRMCWIMHGDKGTGEFFRMVRKQNSQSGIKQLQKEDGSFTQDLS